MGKSKPTLKIAKNYEEGGKLRAPKLNANILLHGYPGGIRHEPIDLKGALRREGFESIDGSIYKVDEGELRDFHGANLQQALKEAKCEYPGLAPLYRAVVKDPLEETTAYVQSMQLGFTAEQYLFDGVIPAECAVEQLQVSRFYRRQKGRPLDEQTKWSQGGRFGDGYVAWKFDVDTDEDVYHCGAGGWLGQTVRGIRTTGVVRCTDPRRDGTTIEMDPPEKVCVSDCSYGDLEGMSNVSHFYTHYAHWREQGKQVYFKGDLCDPPQFPCVVLNSTRPHNREFIGYTDNEVFEIPDYTQFRVNMIQANQARNRKTRDGEIEWPAYDAERVQQLICEEPSYEFQVPSVVDFSRRVDCTTRFPVSRNDLRDRLNLPHCARAYKGITASVIVFLFLTVSALDDGYVDIDILDYPHCENHQYVEELLWSMEECAEKLGLARKGGRLRGMLYSNKRLDFIRFMERHVASR